MTSIIGGLSIWNGLDMQKLHKNCISFKESLVGCPSSCRSLQTVVSCLLDFQKVNLFINLFSFLQISRTSANWVECLNWIATNKTVYPAGSALAFKWHLLLARSDYTHAETCSEPTVFEVRSLKSSILSLGKTFWGMGSAAVEQCRRKANTVAQGDGKFGPRGWWPQNPSKPKK